jgi:ubiquinone/menaquinone biosynthesis C-methylase UbiE
VKDETQPGFVQKNFDFSSALPRPFLSHLPAGINTYEEGVARFFRWRTGLDYYGTIDTIVDFVVNTRRTRVVDMLTDTGAFALRLVERKGFVGKVYSFDSNITLLERARQRARHMNLDQVVEFRQIDALTCPVPDGFAEVAVSIFDLHRQPAREFMTEAARILCPDGHLILAELLQPVTTWGRWRSFWRNVQLRYLQKNPAEADGIYYDQERLIDLVFGAGFRQVIIQGLKVRSSPHEGVFSLIAATK